MNCPLTWRRLMAVGCLGAACVFTGCSRSGSELSELDDPLIRQAHARAQEGNKDMALALLNRALLRKPGLSRAHLDAALLYDQYKQDYVRAIYHYTRYLELRPQPDKRTMIEGLIRQARIAYAASLVDQEYTIDHRLRQLREENERLQNDLREVRANLAKLLLQARGVAPAVPPAPAAVAAPVAPAAAERTYKVQPGDTLSTIAARMYQEPRQWPLIFEANRDVLPGPEKLVVGQTLRIPPH